MFKRLTDEVKIIILILLVGILLTTIGITIVKKNDPYCNGTYQINR